MLNEKLANFLLTILTVRGFTAFISVLETLNIAQPIYQNIDLKP